MDHSRSSTKNQQKIKKKRNNGETTQRHRAQNWSIDQTRVMLNLVREEQLNLRITGPGTFTQQFWNKIAPLLSAQSEPPRQGLELHGQWKTLKSEFYDYKHLADKSGWGWDPDKKVSHATDECWEELRKHNEKLYKCKSKPFIWYDIMNDLCGSNVTNGSYAVGNMSGQNLQQLVSCSDSSGSNRNAEQELDGFDLGAFRNTLGVDSNTIDVDSTPMEHSPEVASVDASGSTSGKRMREGSIGVECAKSSQGKKPKGSSNGRMKNLQYDSAIKMIVEESRERRVLLEQMKNKGKEVADKLLKVKKERNMTRQDFSILQEALTSQLSKDLFMSMEGEELYEWIDERIEFYHLRRGI